LVKKKNKINNEGDGGDGVFFFLIFKFITTTTTTTTKNQKEKIIHFLILDHSFVLSFIPLNAYFIIFVFLILLK
jgi:hypothetical protein